MQQPLSKTEFEQQLRDKACFYHIHHPFHKWLSSGQASEAQIQGWVLNRYYYQQSIPIKDAAILANCDDKKVRRTWLQRIIDHDGSNETDGGIYAWLLLGRAVNLKDEELIKGSKILPAVRFAVDAYVNFARRATWQEAACSSLTEMFAPEIHQNRLDLWPDHYPWIDKQGFGYFRSRLSQARRDVEHGLEITLDYFKSYEQQQHALNILQFKLDILWSMLDAMHLAYFEQKPPYFCCEGTPKYHRKIL